MDDEGLIVIRIISVATIYGYNNVGKSYKNFVTQNN